MPVRDGDQRTKFPWTTGCIYVEGLRARQSSARFSPLTSVPDHAGSVLVAGTAGPPCAVHPVRHRGTTAVSISHALHAWRVPPSAAGRAYPILAHEASSLSLNASLSWSHRIPI